MQFAVLLRHLTGPSNHWPLLGSLVVGMTLLEVFPTSNNSVFLPHAILDSISLQPRYTRFEHSLHVLGFFARLRRLAKKPTQRGTPCGEF